MWSSYNYEKYTSLEDLALQFRITDGLGVEEAAWQPEKEMQQSYIWFRIISE